MQRLSKILAQLGIASRRKSEQIITSGRICVNGKPILIPQHHVDPTKDTITLDGKTLTSIEEKKTFILNKPVGYLCSNRRFGNQKLVIDLFDTVSERLFTVGRLDKDTEGLLIVTNDGHFAQKMIHPSSNIEKEYVIKTLFPIKPIHLTTLTKGCYIESTYVKPVKIKKIGNHSVSVTITEGKKREVRILAQKSGIELQTLKRIRIGGLKLPNLRPGEWLPITEKEKCLIFKR